MAKYKQVLNQDDAHKDVHYAIASFIFKIFLLKSKKYTQKKHCVVNKTSET